MELHTWWWNGSWGRLFRRDVKVYTHGHTWTVEAWQGGAEGTRRTWLDLNRAEAFAVAADLMSDSPGWKLMSE